MCVNDVPGSTIKFSKQLNPENAESLIALHVRGMYNVFTPLKALALFRIDVSPKALLFIAVIPYGITSSSPILLYELPEYKPVMVFLEYVNYLIALLFMSMYINLC